MLKMPEELAQPVLDENTKIVLQKRYMHKDPVTGNMETPQELFWRVASAVAAEEAKYSQASTEELARKFYNAMSELKFLPNSPTLMNAGTELGQLSACFVLPVGDSIEEIFDAVKYAAMIHKSGGGTGFSFSRIRPRDSRVGSTGGVASGPVSFLKIFNTATEQIKQGGTRRGANMGILRIDHPDILEFIKAKEKEGEFNNFNLSVGITEEFMLAVENGTDFPLRVPATGEIVNQVDARELFELLVDKAWRSGDPGIVFLDRINRDNPTPDQGDIESTNPCGEQPLLPYEACNLGSINLSKFHLPEHEAYGADKSIDWEELGRIVDLGVRFLDNVIDASRFPLERISETVHKNRKIGLGIMGFADLLYQLGIPYDSEEGIALAEKLMAFINTRAHEASAKLANERGPFPAYPSSTYARDNLGPYRNATVTTIAPTGTLSIIAGCSSGIEPLFALSFTRNILDGAKLVETNPHFRKAIARCGLESADLLDEVARKGSLKSIKNIPDDLRRVFVTAMDIDPVWHLRMQAAFQRHTDNAVSKTVNLPNSSTREDIRHIYWQAWKEGCKGVTVYRDGCKSIQVLATGEGQKKMDAKSAPSSLEVRKRPDVVNGFTQKVQTGLGAMYLTVNEVDGQPFEVFATIGKSGRSITAKAEAIGRLVSLALRSGVSVRDIVGQIKGIGGEHPVFRDKGLLLSIPDAIAWVLEKRYMANTAISGPQDIISDICPECGQPLLFQEGCLICQSCGYSKCG